MLRYGQFGIRRLSQSQVLSAKKLQYLIDNQWKGTETKIYPTHLQSYFCHKNDTSSFLREFQKWKWVNWVSLEKTLPPPNGSKLEIPRPRKSYPSSQFNPCPKWKPLPNHLQKLFNHGKTLQFFLDNKSCWNIKNLSKLTKLKSLNWSLSNKGMTS